jgi:hypothetical protein
LYYTFSAGSFGAVSEVPEDERQRRGKTATDYPNFRLSRNPRGDFKRVISGIKVLP